MSFDVVIIQNEGGEGCEEETNGEKFQGDSSKFLNEKSVQEDSDQTRRKRTKKQALLMLRSIIVSLSLLC